MGVGEYVVEQTGETLTFREVLAQQRRLEREITRCDVAIETHKESLKAAKDARDKAVRDLRVLVRELKELGEAPRRRRGGVQTSAQVSK